MIGASCADGTVGRNYVSLVVNDEAFAARFAACLTTATGLPTRLESVTRPSGYLQRDAPGYRVRVVSSYLADLMRQYVGGDAHHMRQRFPRVVLRDRETFEGFLDGYTDGDGFRSKSWRGRLLVSEGPHIWSWPRAGPHVAPSNPNSMHWNSGNPRGPRCVRCVFAEWKARSPSLSTVTDSIQPELPDQRSSGPGALVTVTPSTRRPSCGRRPPGVCTLAPGRSPPL